MVGPTATAAPEPGWPGCTVGGAPVPSGPVRQQDRLQRYGSRRQLLRVRAAGSLLVALVVATASASASGPSVVVADYSFKPNTITISVGETVTWTNAGPDSHTVTADGGSFDSGGLGVNDSFANVFDTAGTFEYHCAFHPTRMHGTVVVLGAGVSPSPAGTPPPTPPPGTRPPDLPTPTLASEPPATAAPTASTEPSSTPSTGAGRGGSITSILVGAGAVLGLVLVLILTNRGSRGRT